MTTPRISVIIPSYEHEPYVGRAIRSVFEQADPDLELVVVDDGSTDGSRAVIREALQGAGDTRVVYHEQENAGAHAALAKGVELSSGSVIAILNSDDFFDAARMARLRERLTPEADFLLFTGLELVGPDDEPLPPRNGVARWYQTALRQSVQCPTVGFALLCNNLCVTSGNLVFTRGLYEKVGGFRPFRYCHDWDFILRCTWHVEPVFLPEILGCYRLHESNTIESSDPDAVDAEYGELLTDYLLQCEAGRPTNALAPCRENWPAYFPYFVRTHSRFDSRNLLELVGEPRLAGMPEAGPGAWRAWRGGAVELSTRDDLGVLVDPAGASGAAANALESQVLLRELALVRLGLHERYADFAPRGLTDLELVRAWSARLPSPPE